MNWRWENRSIKELVRIMLSVRISSYGCTPEVWRAQEKRIKLCAKAGFSCDCVQNSHNAL